MNAALLDATALALFPATFAGAVVSIVAYLLGVRMGIDEAKVRACAPAFGVWTTILTGAGIILVGVCGGEL